MVSHRPGVGRKVPKWKQKIHMWLKASIWCTGAVSQHNPICLSTQQEEETMIFKTLIPFWPTERCYSVTSNMPMLFTDWGNHMSTLLLTQHLFPLEPCLNLKFCPFLQDFWASRRQAQLQGAVNSFIPTAGCTLQPSQLHKYRRSKTSIKQFLETESWKLIVFPD